MTFWTLIKSIFLVCLCAHPIVLGVVGLAQSLSTGKSEGLFAVLATPMTLAFFGLPALFSCLFVIVSTYYALSLCGRREIVPYVVFAVGAGVLLYQFIAEPALTGAMAGYDQTAQVFTAASLVIWAFYAFLRTDLRRP